MKFCVYTRAFFENAYLTFFIEHYLRLGFDKIIILHCGGPPFVLPEHFSQSVDIHYVQNRADSLLPIYDYLIKNSDFDWVLSVDNDELLIFNQHYKTIHDYVLAKLSIHSNINAFYFRWGMIEKYDSDNRMNLSFLLNNYKIFANPHIKTMFKKSDLIQVCHSHYANLQFPTIFFENQLLTHNQPLIPISPLSYSEHILIHLHTRSLHDLVFKAFTTAFAGKEISCKNDFIRFINSFQPSLPTDALLPTFIQTIGPKAKLPFIHHSPDLVSLAHFDTSLHAFPICAPNDLTYVLNSLNLHAILLPNYFLFISALSAFVLHEHTFIRHSLPT